MSYTDSNANTQQAQNSVKTLNTIKKFVIFYRDRRVRCIRYTGGRQDENREHLEAC